MAKRTVYLYRDQHISIVPTRKVNELKRAAEAIFVEYKRHKCTRGHVLEHKLKVMAQTLYIWTRPTGGL